ncbi:hypothetical protein BC936DRAFT_145542 [Jimgerdemannia flammicorona]|uniref:Uncharacterized protein n=2 Tax=Jimgerdemannia flammicorona TaxID=994334 RepID=A0A433D9R0_9FUNG|nr:hypothetical protein BC936DRAFT_145542 [Jimgerdemannia flammicorona]RUS27957.1 hypothetical protein BC938DRAFT_482520 [Jimgerdemannia flammicorona]
MAELPADSTEGGTDGNTGLGEDEGEGGCPDITRGVEQQRVVGGKNETLKEDGNDIEEKNTPEDVADGTGHSLAGVLGFTSRDAHKLGTLEGKAGGQKYTNGALKTANKRSRIAIVPEPDRPLATDRTSIDKNSYFQSKPKRK